MIYLVNKDNPDALSMAMKLVDQSHLEGAVIPCSSGEMACYGSNDFQAISLNDITTSLVRVYPNSSYILFADEGTEIEDAISSSKYLGIKLGIIRTNHA